MSPITYTRKAIGNNWADCCDLCGALVLDRGLHHVFHEGLVAVGNLAYRADAWNTPLKGGHYR